MIINTGMRTDIPAFYSKWLMNRIREGYVFVIDEYNTCGHLYKYCYANYNKGLLLENMRKHNENSPLLIGELSKEDKITEAKQKSWKIVNEQISFL